MDDLDSVRYIVDASGTQTRVELSVAQYKALIAKLEALEAQVASHEQYADNATENDFFGAYSWVEEKEFSIRIPGGNAHAYARYRPEQFVVIKGSRVRGSTVRSMPDDYREIRERLEKQGIIATVDGALVFTKTERFDDPSVPACIICGSSINGYDKWVDEDGRSLKELGFSR